jgi:starch synthase
LLEAGEGLSGALRARGRSFVGVLEGVDASVWNASTDPWLESRYDAMDLVGGGRYGKHRCKTALQKELGLQVRDDVPLIALVSSISSKGLELTRSIVPALLRNDVQLAVVAEPGADAEGIEGLAQLAARWPDRMAVRRDAEAGAIHRALGAADLVLLPATDDPTGVLAMQAHRYGALPIAARSGAYVDAVVDCDPKLVSGTGFLWDGEGEGLLGAVQRAVAGYANREAFRALAHRAMLVDHGWERTARLYEKLYRNTPAEAASVVATA